MSAILPAPVGVVGTGVMGCGIAQALVEQGVDVVLLGRRPAAFADLRERIAAAARMGARRKRTTKDLAEAGLERLRLTDERADLADAVFLIEAVTEDLDAKADAIGRLLPVLPDDATIATNTSALAVAAVAEAADRFAAAAGDTPGRAAGRTVGLHFMNPVAGSKLAELVRPEATAPAHADRARACAEGLGLAVVETADTPGFAVNRMLMPMIAQAAALLEEEGADAKAIDDAMRLGCGHPMGPLALADFIGLDVVLAELDALAAAHGPAYAPPGMLRRHVADGRLGRKTGAGFHT